MSNYDNTNRGAIWGNADKQKDTHPDFTGSLNVDGKEYWVSAWKRKADASDKAPALSFSVKPKDEKGEGQSKPAPNNDEIPGKPENMDSFDDDIPFN